MLSLLSLIIFGLYAILVIIYVLICLFIIYHIVKYSIDQEIKVVMLIFFITMSSGLLFSNILLFSAIRWTDLISSILPSPY